MKLVYLFGAGASAGAIPHVKAIKDNDTIVKFGRDLDAGIGVKMGYPNWQSIAEEIQRFYSFDTLAKKLSVTDRKKYGRLKCFIQAYMLYEQLYRTTIKGKGSNRITLEKVDQRYYPWVLNFFDSNKRFPNNIKVLTWNYDIQLPMVLRDVTNSTLTDWFGNNHKMNDKAIEIYGFPMPIYLNGAAVEGIAQVDEVVNALTASRDIREVQDGKLPDHTENYKIIFDFFDTWLDRFDKQEGYVSPINYSWDIEGVRSTALREVAAADTLVIVGYSFPLFNRKWDKDILTEFVIERFNNDETPSIYIQDLNPEPIKEKLISMIGNLGPKFNSWFDPNWVKLEDNIDEFFVPHEFDPSYE